MRSMFAIGCALMGVTAGIGASGQESPAPLGSHESGWAIQENNNRIKK